MNNVPPLHNYIQLTQALLFLYLPHKQLAIFSLSLTSSLQLKGCCTLKFYPWNFSLTLLPRILTPYLGFPNLYKKR